MSQGCRIIAATIAPRGCGRGSPRPVGGNFLVLLALSVTSIVAPAPAAPAAERVGQPPARFVPPAARPLAGPSAATPTSTGKRVDHAVVPAGAIHAGPCGRCSRKACPQCRLPAEQAPFHGACQHGLCPAHCPVRPDVFGFYGTQWRKWPGSGVVPASFQEEATPARPPKAEVPKATEESLQPPGGEDAAAADAPKAREPDAAGEEPEDLPPVKRKVEPAADAPLPKPFPEADDGAAAPSPALQRARRRIRLDRALDGPDAPAPIVAVEHDEPTEQRGGGTPWRRFLSAVPEAPDVPAAPLP